MSLGNAGFSLWASLSILSSVGIILVNKTVMRLYGFDFVLSLTTLHFASQALLMEALARAKWITPQRLPLKDNVLTAIAGVASIAFMNYNLQLNSVGFYQMTKLLCIPLLVYIETAFYGKKYSGKVKLALVLVLLGVGIAAVSDVEVNFLGTFMGALAVFATTQFQLWQGAKKDQFGVTPIQITHSVSFPLALICGICALLTEGISAENSVFQHEFQSPMEVFLIAVSCLLAISVNVCSFTLIGSSSPVTYQVIGHLKTVLVLFGGMTLFPFQGSPERFFNNLVGIVVAMAGVILYGHLKTTQGNDILDNIAPAFLLEFLSKFDSTPQFAGKDMVELDEVLEDEPLKDSQPNASA